MLIATVESGGAGLNFDDRVEFADFSIFARDWMKSEPILAADLTRDSLDSSGLLGPYAALDAELKAVCDEAVKFAEESPEPELSALHEDILA